MHARVRAGFVADCGALSLVRARLVLFLHFLSLFYLLCHPSCNQAPAASNRRACKQADARGQHVPSNRVSASTACTSTRRALALHCRLCRQVVCQVCVSFTQESMRLAQVRGQKASCVRMAIVRVPSTIELKEAVPHPSTTQARTQPSQTAVLPTTTNTATTASRPSHTTFFAVRVRAMQTAYVSGEHSPGRRRPAG